MGVFLSPRYTHTVVNKAEALIFTNTPLIMLKLFGEKTMEFMQDWKVETIYNQQHLDLTVR